MPVKQPAPRLLTPAEVASMLRVDPKTVTRWALQGRLQSVRTPGGHRRYLETEVMAYVNGSTQTARAQARQ